MTEDEFIAENCARSGLTRDELAKRKVAVPCDCGNPSCPGWMMIPGPDALAGPFFTVPSGLTRDEIHQFITDCANGKIPPSRA